MKASRMVQVLGVFCNMSATPFVDIDRHRVVRLSCSACRASVAVGTAELRLASTYVRNMLNGTVANVDVKCRTITHARNASMATCSSISSMPTERIERPEYDTFASAALMQPVASVEVLLECDSLSTAMSRTMDWCTNFAISGV